MFPATEFLLITIVILLVFIKSKKIWDKAANRKRLQLIRQTHRVEAKIARTHRNQFGGRRLTTSNNYDVRQTGTARQRAQRRYHPYQPTEQPSFHQNLQANTSIPKPSQQATAQTTQSRQPTSQINEGHTHPIPVEQNSATLHIAIHGMTQERMACGGYIESRAA